MKERKEFEFKEVTPYTMDKLTNIYGAYQGHIDNAFDHIAKSALSGCVAVAATVLSLHMLGNPDVIRENLLKFTILGVCVPVGSIYSTITNFKKFKVDRQFANKTFRYLNKERRDIPIKIIVETYEQNCDETTELNKMIESSPEPKFIKKLGKKWEDYNK